MKKLGKFLVAATAISAATAAIVYYFEKRKETDVPEDDFDDFEDFDDDLETEPVSEPVTREYVSLNNNKESEEAPTEDSAAAPSDSDE